MSDELIEVPVNEIGNEIVSVRFADVVAAVMNEAQFAIISGRTPKQAIKKREGKGGKTFSYVPHGYVTAQLNKAFGFDWDFETTPNGRGEMYTYFEEAQYTMRNKKYTRPASCIVHVKLTFRIRNPQDIRQVIATIVKTATGEREDAGGMTMGSLIKAAESDGLKKAASKLGVALDLYWADAETDYLTQVPPPVPLPTITDEQRAHVAQMRADGETRGAIAAYLNVSKGDLGQLLPEMFE